MSKQQSFALAVAFLMIAAALRIIGLGAVPPGLSTPEAQDAQIVELTRFGQIEVLYELESGGRESLYHVLVSAVTVFIGNHPLGYRALSVWFSLLALSFTYTLTRQMYGRYVGVGALAALAMPLWSVLLSRTIAREALLLLLVVMVLMAFARALPVYRRPNLNPSTLPFAALGVILGIGFYIHPAHYMIVLSGMVFIAYMILTRQPMSRRTLSYLNFTILILIIVAMPYLITILRRPDLGGAARLADVLNAVRSEGGLLLPIARNLMGLLVWGDTNVLHNVPGRPYVDPISGLLILWGALKCGRRFLEPRYALPLIVFIGVLPVSLFAPHSPNFMGYVVIMPLLAIFFAIGAKAIAKSLPRVHWGTAAVSGVIVANLLWSVIGLGQWGQHADVKTAYHDRAYALARYLDSTVSGTRTVVCTPMLPTYPTWLASTDNPATLLALMMDNPDADQIRYAECGSGLVLTRGGEHQQVIMLREDGAEGFHPTIRTWVNQGDLLQTEVAQGVVSMIVDDTLGDRVGRFTTTAPVGYAPESPGGVAPVSLPVGFENNLTFLGYETPDNDNTYTPGDIITVISYWRVDGSLPEALNIFVHLLFDAETLVTQTDTISVQSQQLQPRDVFLQVSFVTLPQQIPSGDYQISIGAYQSGTDRRLSVLDGDTTRGNRLFLNEIQVVPPATTVDANEGGES